MDKPCYQPDRCRLCRGLISLVTNLIDVDCAEGEADVDDDEDEEKDQDVDYHVCHTRKNIHILLQYIVQGVRAAVTT